MILHDRSFALPAEVSGYKRLYCAEFGDGKVVACWVDDAPGCEVEAMRVIAGYCGE